MIWFSPNFLISKFPSIHSFWKIQKMKIVSPNNILTKNILTTECITVFWSEMVNITAHANLQSCFSVYCTQLDAAGNVNEKKTTSSAPDDIFQETPTQVVESSRGKRVSWIGWITHLQHWPAKKKMYVLNLRLHFEGFLKQKSLYFSKSKQCC